MPVDPNEILAKIRASKRPLVKVHTGDIESMRPGEDAQIANEWVEEWTEDAENKTSEDISPSALEAEWVEVGEWEHGISRSAPTTKWLEPEPGTRMLKRK